MMDREKADWQWVYENPRDAAKLIDVLTDALTKISEQNNGGAQIALEALDAAAEIG